MFCFSALSSDAKYQANIVQFLSEKFVHKNLSKFAQFAEEEFKKGTACF